MSKQGSDEHQEIDDILNEALTWVKTNMDIFGAKTSFSPYQIIKNTLTEISVLNNDEEKLTKFKAYCEQLADQQYDISNEEYNRPVNRQIIDNIEDAALVFLEKIALLERENKDKKKTASKQESGEKNSKRRVQFTNFATVKLYHNPSNERFEKLQVMNPELKLPKNKKGEPILPPMQVTGPRGSTAGAPTDQNSYTTDDPLNDTKGKDIPDSEVDESFAHSVTNEEIEKFEAHLEKIYGSNTAINFTVIGDDTYEAQIFHENGDIEKRIFSAQDIQQFEYSKNVDKITSVQFKHLEAAFKNELAKVEANTPYISMQYLKSVSASVKDANTCQATLKNISTMFTLLKEGKQEPLEKAQMAYAYFTQIQKSFPVDGHKYASALNQTCELIKQLLVSDMDKDNKLSTMIPAQIEYHAREMGNLLRKAQVEPPTQDRPHPSKPSSKG